MTRVRRRPRSLGADQHLPSLAGHLRAVLDAVAAGELVAERDQVAFLRGALAVAETLSDAVSVPRKRDGDG